MPIEAEGEFVEVVVEMLVLDTALESPQQPPFEQGGDFVDAWHDHVSRFRAAAYHHDLMVVAGGWQPSIAAPAVGLNCRPRPPGFLQEDQQTLDGYVLNTPKADAPGAALAPFSRHRDDGLPLELAAPLTFFRAAQIGFVGLDLADTAVAAGVHHGPPQLAQPGPERCLGSQRPPLGAFQASSVHKINQNDGNEKDTPLLENRPTTAQLTDLT